jgi:hypothetical protein
MGVFEMHLELNQRLQEVASYKRDKFLPQELDMALNKAMFRLLQLGVDSKFEDDQINLSHVSALIKKNKSEILIKPSTSDPLYEDTLNNSYSIVPADLYWFINGRVETVSDPIHCEIAPTLALISKTEYTAVVPFPSIGSAPYYSSTVVASTGMGGVLYLSPTQITAGFTSINSKYVVVNNIIETLYRKYTTLSVYWERYRDTYSKDSFIFVSSVPLGVVSVVSGGQTSSVTSSTTTYPIYNRAAIPSITNKTVAVVPIKVQEGDMLYSALKENRYYKTRKTEVSMDQTYDYFILYSEESFLITIMSYDYIRKPRTISLLLNQSCELADSTHPRIIDLAVELLRLDTKDQAYQQTVQDTQLRTK